jgi:hypothetical protein
MHKIISFLYQLFGILPCSFIITAIILFNCAAQKCIPNTSFHVEKIYSNKLLMNYLAYKDGSDILNSIIKKIEIKADSLKQKNPSVYNNFFIMNFNKGGNMYKLNEKLSQIFVDTLNNELFKYRSITNLDFLVDASDSSIISCNDKYILKDKSKSGQKKALFIFGICDFANYRDITDSLLHIFNLKYESDKYMFKFKYIDSTNY